MTRCRHRAARVLSAAAAFAPGCFALTQVSLSRSRLRRASDEGPCSCLNWKELYSSGRLACSPGGFPAKDLSPDKADGMLLTLEGMTSLGQELCNRFISLVDDTVCLNVNWAPAGARQSDQWCFVSRECETGAVANSTASLRLKRCSAGRDAMLRDKLPEELQSYAAVKHLGLGLAMKMAYPVEKGLLPRQVAAFFGLDPNVRIVAPSPEKLERIQQLRDSAVPTVLDPPEGNFLPFAVVHGSKTYLVDADPGSKQDLLSDLLTFKRVDSHK